MKLLQKSKLFLLELILLCWVCCSSFVVAQKPLDNFNIIPEAKSKWWTGAVEALGKPQWDFWSMYNYFGDSFDNKWQADKNWDVGDLWSSFSTGIFTWNTILLFVIRMGRWIANVALVAGAACVIYAGYIYASSVLAGDNTSKANDAIKYAAIGITVITCAYGFMRIVIGAFL